MPIYRIQQGERLMKKTQIIVMAILLAFLVSAQNATAFSKSRAVLSPYFQTDPGSTYTLVGISHPSLSSSASTVGLTVATVGTSTAGTTAFTIQAGETYRIFIVSTNHAQINSVLVTGDQVLFLSMTSGSSESSQLTFQSSQTNPTVQSVVTNNGGGLRGLNMLSIWGAVVFPGTSSGFAMEFIGDAHDSASVSVNGAVNSLVSNSNSIGAGRGIN